MNKRPLPCVLAGFVLGEVWIWQFHGTAALAALCLATIICIVIGWKRKGGFFCLLFIGIGLCIGGIRQFQWETYKEDMKVCMNQPVCTIEGQVKDIIEKDDSYGLVVDHVRIDKNERKGSMLIYPSEQINCYIGCRIKCTGRLEAFRSATNPGGFDQRRYREGRGILAVSYKAEVEKIHYGSFLIGDGIYNIRQRMKTFMEQNLDEEVAGVGIAMTLGEKGSLDEEQKSLYELGGITHVLAVSGLHMSLLGAGIYKLFRRAGAGYPLSVVVSIPCIIVYAIMTGMASSCQRAAIMLMIYLLAELKGYYYDLPSSLSLAGVWLLGENPARLFDSGFLLSFGVMLAVGILCPSLFHLFRYETGKKKLRDSFLSGSFIILFTLPLSLSFFYGFSLAGLLLNLLVIPLMSFLVPLLFVGGTGGILPIPGDVTDVCFLAAEWILRFYSFLCKTAEKIPFSYVQTGYRGIGFAICYYSILFGMAGILYLFYRKYSKRVLYLVPIMIVMIFMFVHQTGRRDSFLTMLDVGQGDGVLYHSDEGEICMIDGGSSSEHNIGRYVIQPALEYYGVNRVDYWFLSHLDEDHISGLKELLQSGYPVDNLILPVRKEKNDKQQELEQLAADNKTKIHYMKQGDKLELKDSVFYCIYPRKNNVGDENENSMVLLLDTSHQQILLTGDVEKEGEKNMTKELRQYDFKNTKERILKVAHHGSANGTKEILLECFNPDTALISCAAKNRYGHPAKETVERLQKTGSAIYYTMKHGAIEIRLGKETSYLGYGMVR